jgi:hypothetical protein
MAFNLSKTITSAVSTGLMLGAVACGGSQQPAEAPEAAAPAAEPGADSAAMPAAEGEPTAAAAEAKACCKGLNECKAKGGCKTDANACHAQNECKGKGGCNGHCPK